jgi:hypothetical protein
MTAPAKPSGAPDAISFGRAMLIVEGDSDACFLRNLLQHHTIPDVGVYHGRHPLPSGKQGFTQVLLALPVRPGFEVVRRLVVVTDSDDDPVRSFAAVQEQLKAAGFGTPERPMKFGPRRNELPPAAVLLLPWEDEAGDLEHLLLPAARDRWPEQTACVDIFAECAKTLDWPMGKSAKMRIRALLTSVCKEDPNVGLAHLWDRSVFRDHIPLGHTSLNRLVSYLRELAE